ncbi:hypothetical protein GR268_48450, partial [Rhizobium leguminosarum]|nr:hypothetical protein [Rhizobium leguminosarum]
CEGQYSNGQCDHHCRSKFCYSPNSHAWFSISCSYVNPNLVISSGGGLPCKVDFETCPGFRFDLIDCNVICKTCQDHTDRATLLDFEHAKVGYDKVGNTSPRKRQRAFGQKLWLALGLMLHENNNLLDP